MSKINAMTISIYLNTVVIIGGVASAEWDHFFIAFFIFSGCFYYVTLLDEAQHLANLFP